MTVLLHCQGCLVEWDEGRGNTRLLGMASPSTPLFETYMLEDVVEYHRPQLMVVVMYIGNMEARDIDNIEARTNTPTSNISQFLVGIVNKKCKFQIRSSGAR